MTFFTFVAPLAAIGLVHGDMENELYCCVVRNISANSWRLHAQALLLLVLPQKSNMLPDLSASDKRQRNLIINDYVYLIFVLLGMNNSLCQLKR